MISRTGKLMMNISVLVHENDGSLHLLLYPNILPIHVSARSEGVKICNFCDNKFVFNSGRVLHSQFQECLCSEPPL